MDRSRTPPIRYVLQANFACIGLPSAASQRGFALFYKRIGGLWGGHVVAVRPKTLQIRYVLQAKFRSVGFSSETSQRKFAMFYKRI